MMGDEKTDLQSLQEALQVKEKETAVLQAKKRSMSQKLLFMGGKRPFFS